MRIRFFGEVGKHIQSAFDGRVLGISADRLRAIPGGSPSPGARESTAIKAALRGRWANVLIADPRVAQRLVPPTG